MGHAAASLFLFAPPFFIVLPGLLMITYGIGGIGLVRQRAWASMVVILTAVAQLVLSAFSAAMLFAVSEDFWLAVTLSYPIIQALLILIPPLLIAYLALRLRKNPNAWRPSVRFASGSTESTAKTDNSVSLRVHRWVFWGIIAIGAALPWIVGAGVKIYLDAQGKPTWPWSAFLNIGTPFWIVPLSAWLSASYIGLAFVSKRILTSPLWGLRSFRARAILISGALVGGCIGTVWVFVGVFWEFDPLSVVAPLGFYNVPFIVLGAVLGFLFGKLVESNVA